MDGNIAHYLTPDSCYVESFWLGKQVKKVVPQSCTAQCSGAATIVAGQPNVRFHLLQLPWAEELFWLDLAAGKAHYIPCFLTLMQVIRQFIKEIFQMANKHIQNIQTLLVQIKIITRCHFSSVKLAKIKNINTHCWGIRNVIFHCRWDLRLVLSVLDNNLKICLVPLKCLNILN